MIESESSQQSINAREDNESGVAISKLRNDSNVQVICRINTSHKMGPVKVLRRSNSMRKVVNSPLRLKATPKGETSCRKTGIPISTRNAPLKTTSSASLRSPTVSSQAHAIVDMRMCRSRSRDAGHFRSASSQSRKYSVAGPGLVNSSSLQSEAKYCVFTTKERSNIVVTSENPISGRIINEQVTDAKDLRYFLSACHSNGFQNSVFHFDQVFNETKKQEKFYTTAIKPLMQGFLEGENACVVFFGPTSSGKTYSLQGKTGIQRGVVPRTVEDILTIVKNSYGQDQENSMLEEYGTNIISINQAKKGAYDQDDQVDHIYLKMQVFMIYCEQVLDLLAPRTGKRAKFENYIDKETNQVMSKIVNMTEKIVVSIEQYYSIMQDAFRERRMYATKYQDHDIRKRSHLIVNLALVKRDNISGELQEISNMNFCELSGSEQSVKSEAFIRDTSIRQFVTKSFNCLSTQLLKAALGKRTHFEEGDSMLVQALKPTMSSNSAIMLVECCSPSPQYFDHTLPAIKFCARIRDTIMRKCHRQRTHQKKAQDLKQDRTPEEYKSSKFNQDLLLQGGRNSTFGRPATQETGRHSRRSSRGSNKGSTIKTPALPMIPNVGIYDEIRCLVEQLEGEVQLYDALVREFSHGNNQACDLDEVREWCIRSNEEAQKSLYRIQQSRGIDINFDCDTQMVREESIEALSYLKTRIGEIEQKVIALDPFKESRSSPSRSSCCHHRSRSRGSQRSFNRDIKMGSIELGQSTKEREFNSVMTGGVSSARRNSSIRGHASNKRNRYDSVADSKFTQESASLRHSERRSHSPPGVLRLKHPVTIEDSPITACDTAREADRRSRRNSNQRYDPYEKQLPTPPDISVLPCQLKPILVNARELPSVNAIKEKFMTSGKIDEIIRCTYGERQDVPCVYKSAEDTLTDVQRLIMLEDFEGLKRRVMQLYRERTTQNEQLKTQAIEIAELKEQVDARDRLYKQVEELNSSNLDEYQKSMKELHELRDREEKEFREKIHELMQSVQQKSEMIKSLEEEIAKQERTVKQNIAETEYNRKLMQEAETKYNLVSEENKKLYFNYEVLKEHELNIIQDFQKQKKDESSELEKRVAQFKQDLEGKNDELHQAQRKIVDLQDEIKRMAFETTKISEQKSLADESHNVLQAKLEREVRDKQELSTTIHSLEKSLQNAKDNITGVGKEKQAALNEIKQLHELIKEMEQTISGLNQELEEKQSNIRDNEIRIEQLQSNARCVDERIELKNKEIRAVEQREQALEGRFEQLQFDYDSLDRQLIKLKASEFDKVDVLKVNADLEGRVKNLSNDIDHLVKERNTLEVRANDAESENHKLKEDNRQLETELAYFRRTHDSQLDKFDQKFSQFQNELQALTNENVKLREKEKSWKRQMRDLENEMVQKHEQARHVEIRNKDLESKLQGLHGEMFRLGHEKEKEQIYRTLQHEQRLQTRENNQRAIDDIKSMIGNYKQVTMKENNPRVSNLLSSRGKQYTSLRDRSQSRSLSPE